MTERYVLELEEVDATQIARAGGKAANLGELARIDGVRVPGGFCVTTDAFQRVIADTPSVGDQLDQLAHVNASDREAIRRLSAELRSTVERITLPDDVAGAIQRALVARGEHAAYAIRSSATAEDTPTASFAGQQDTYLNIIGPAAILEHVIRCWASLYSERAVTYRLRNDIDHRKVRMAVIVQEMLFPDSAGVMFTADPVTSNRTIVFVEATLGLGEALVSGRVNADSFRVRDGAIVAKTIAVKQLAIRASPKGGTHEQAVERDHQQQATLTDGRVVRLAQLGRHIEAHFGHPQDVEWCLVDDGFAIVQSRPITTLFPVPEVDDGENHVYISVGHQQMMTDALKPLGLSMWQLTVAAPMNVAGGRLFVDVTTRLASPASRGPLMDLIGRSDPLIGDALQTIVERGDFLPTPPEDAPIAPPIGGAPAAIETDPAIVAHLIERNETSLAALRREIQTRSGSAVFDFILTDLHELKRVLFDPPTLPVIMAGMEASWWLNDHLQAWLGETNAADTLTLSAPNNVTSEMGLALLDVADAIRQYPDVVAFLQRVDNDEFLEEITELAGGREARDAIEAWLGTYGMRCVGEIDITRPRWSERPSMLVPVILGNIKHFTAGAAERRFEQGQREATLKEVELLERLRSLPDGDHKADETKRMIDRVRTFIGYREYPKYGMISRYFVYKLALLREAARLVDIGLLRDLEESFYLTFQELHDVVRTEQVDHDLIRRRKEAFTAYQALTPPRVLTSDGEVINGAYRRDNVPTGALVGLPVSAGVVEGRARVLLQMGQAELEPGDILVTAFTDPSWSPLFVSVSGLVTEVGGLMTHGAVVAREYGLPAVVGVQDATRLIQDGQRIRVDGAAGYVEILTS